MIGNISAAVPFMDHDNEFILVATLILILVSAAGVFKTTNDIYPRDITDNGRGMFNTAILASYCLGTLSSKLAGLVVSRIANCWKANKQAIHQGMLAGGFFTVINLIFTNISWTHARNEMMENGFLIGGITAGVLALKDAFGDLIMQRLRGMLP